MATATATEPVYTIEERVGFSTTTYVVLKDGQPLQSPKYGDTRFFSTRSGARKAIHRDRNGLTH